MISRFVLRLLVTLLSSLASEPGFLFFGDAGPREQIGEVLGRPVYRDEILKGESRVDELNRLFLAPVLFKYRQEHKEQITPTDREIQAAQKIFDDQHAERMKEEGAALADELRVVEERLKLKDLPADERTQLAQQKSSLQDELKAPGRRFAEFVLINWKFQRHLYDKFGGGRLLWQQRGLEAVDAMRTLIETQEKEGAFKISDPELRDRFYADWTTLESDVYVIKDKERIRAEFLEPEWAPVASK